MPAAVPGMPGSFAALFAWFVRLLATGLVTIAAILAVVGVGNSIAGTVRRMGR